MHRVAQRVLAGGSSHAVAACPSSKQPTRARTSRAGLTERVRQPDREHTRVDDARHRRSDRHGREHWEPEHVLDVVCAEGTPVLVDEHDTGRASGRRHAHRAPQREVAAPHDENGGVGDLEQRFERCGFEDAEIDDGRGRVLRASATPSAAPTSGATSVRSSRPAGSNVTPWSRARPDVPVRRPGRRHRRPAIRATRGRVVREPEHRWLITIEIDEPNPFDAAGERQRGTRPRSQTCRSRLSATNSRRARPLP